LRARVPTVVIVGTHDQIVTRTVRRRIANQLPPVSIRQIEGAGHMPMLERAEETSGLVSDFLADTFGHSEE
jgi:3-oxoadipate enol-lactonase